jgi:hypothetical protein
MHPLERTILHELFVNKQFAERVVPYIKSDYFHTPEAINLFKFIARFFTKYHVLPSVTAIRIGIDNASTLSENEVKATRDALTAVEAEAALPETQHQWLMEETELWVKDRAVYCALQESITVMDDPKRSVNTIPDIMKQALAVSFDTHLGHDYFRDAEERWKFYHNPQARLSFDLDLLNTLTKNGVPRKTLNVIFAGTNVGKSLGLVHLAAAYVRTGLNVVYFTMEMAEEWVSQRVDANMFDIPMDDVETLPQTDFIKKLNVLRNTTIGRLVTKEYPTATASVAEFRTFLQEIRLKDNFTPDVIIVDYLTICASERVKLSHQSVNSYSYGKFIAEELRGLMKEFNAVGWTAAQFNRQGFASTDPGLEHVGESFGIPQTADFCVALVTTDELEKIGQIALFELKNRYNKKKSFQQHLLGIDTPRMKLYDLNAQQLAQSITLPSASATPVAPTASPGFTGRKRSPLQTLKQENAQQP